MRLYRSDVMKMVIIFFETVKGLLKSIKLTEALGLCSRINLVNFLPTHSTWHIPMMDFCCPRTSVNLKRLKSDLKIIGKEFGLKNGVILDSGKSYHYYGLGSIFFRVPMESLSWEVSSSDRPC